MSLAAEVRRVLEGNAVDAADGRYTRPARATYPHQWLWDSCFHARIWAALGEPARAHDELRALFRAQVASGLDRGMLPHMTLFGGTPAEAAQDPNGAAQHARDAALWGSPRASSITQPPIMAETVRDVGDARLWRALFEPLCAAYDWWLARRDPRGEHLYVCHHVWETGADATPRADGAFTALLATGRTPRAIANGTINPTAKKRPELLAARFLMLEDLQEIDAAERDGSLAATAANTRRLALYGHVAIEMQAHLVTNLRALAEISAHLGQPERGARYRREADAICDAVNAQLWDDAAGTYVDRWGHPARAIAVRTYAPLVALHAPGLVPPDRARRLIAQLADPARFAARWPIPTVARDEAVFDADEYWRGSTWINVNWFVVRGLARHGALDEARALATRTVELVASVGLREYYRADGDAPAGFGPTDFGWSGLALDLARMLETELA